MNVIVRYILRELGIIFLIGFLALTCLLLIVGIVQVVIDRHIPLAHTWQLIPFVFAEMSAISLPVTLLLAVTIFFSRMSGNNEVVALKALGIPPRTFLMPAYVIAFIVSLLGVAINEISVTWGPKGINAVLYQNAENIFISQLQKNRHFETDDKQIAIMVKGVDAQRRLIEPTIMLKRESATIEAQSARITIDFNANMLTITLEDFRVTSGFGRAVGGSRELTFPLSEIVPDTKRERPSNLSLHRINREMQRTTELIEQQRRIIAAHRTFAAGLGSVDAWMTPQIAEAKRQIRQLQSRYDRLAVEPPRRWATGFCCFFFVWLGAPLAIWMRKSDFFSSFFACFLPILVLYYPLLMFGLSQAKNGTLPPMSVWIANAVIGLIGFWFLRQVSRY
ncbi:MAG: LptF/LptG family permease [Planctomycetaceae bacterium]|nr:LptF/LptG family permease [Planctomycetaceae bacterium]